MGDDAPDEEAAPAFDEAAVTHGEADLGDVRLHYVSQGSGPLVVLLHGFPEFWYSWRYQLGPLAAAGYHAVAVDMRGYNTSSKPTGLDAYRGDVLAGDVSRLIKHLGEERAVVVGHDWGAIVAWMTAILHPDQVERLAILNVPHPVVMRRGLKTFRQLLKSWYVLFFQLPGLPELSIRAFGFSAFRRMFRGDIRRPAAFSDADLDRYVEALAVPGALTAALSYYRAALRRPPGRKGSLRQPLTCPVRIIWGVHDRYLGRELATPPAELVPEAEVFFLEDASHWVQVDRPGKVNELLLEFLRAD